MSLISLFRSRALPPSSRDGSSRFRLSAPVLTMIVVAAVGTIWMLRYVDDPRTHTGMKVTVLDGDSFRSGAETYRLIDIDAPELHQTCKDAQHRDWPCGTAARDRLAALALYRDLACKPRGIDRYGRMLAQCSARGIRDLGETMVREGLALDYGRGAGSYFKAERAARDARRGVWTGDFERPQDWRNRNARSDARS